MLLGVVFAGTIVCTYGIQDRLLIIDTGFNDPYTYKNFIELANSVGFRAEVKSFYNLSPGAMDAYGSILVNLDDSFVADYLKNKDTQEKVNPITKKISSLVSLLKKSKCRILGFMLPSKMGSSVKDSCRNAFGLTMSAFEGDKVIKKSLYNFLQELMQSDSKRSLYYHTTLLTKHEKNEKLSECAAKSKIPNYIDEKSNSVIVGHLPYHGFQSFPPLAWYYADKKTGRQYIITKASLMLFSDIGENFIYNPMEFPLRTQRLQELQQLLYEMYRASVIGRFSKSLSNSSLIVPHLFSKNYLLDAKKRLRAQRSCSVDKRLYDWIEQELIWCGWGGMNVYTKKSSLKSLADAKLNLMWFQMNPESHLADAGLKKTEKKSFLQQISFITAQLRDLSANQSVPHFFVGTEITSNYFNKNVKNPVIDCFGTVYTKIPSPFDFENFWKKEVLDVFDRLIAEWPSISHGIPLAGIFFDLEMYHAQDQAAHYLSSMDFSDLAWHIFCRAHRAKKCCFLKDTSVRVKYLLENNLFDFYFKTLQKKAFEIGLAIKNHITKKAPNLLIGIYDIHLPHSWFYKGFLAGLSSQQRPIILATFNNDFYCHYPWLMKHGIYAYHLPALLLSKFKKIEDFNLVHEISQFHDGAWFNRISRLEEPRKVKEGTQWDYGVEVTPLETTVFVRELRNAISQIQKNDQLNCEVH